jgi:hypothetical protein
MRQSPYAYTLEMKLTPQSTPMIIGVFTWPNVVKKYIRETYSVDGELHLPPDDRVVLRRFVVNQSAGTKPAMTIIDIEAFLAQ